jgi:hypothetical protein
MRGCRKDFNFGERCLLANAYESQWSICKRTSPVVARTTTRAGEEICICQIAKPCHTVKAVEAVTKSCKSTGRKDFNDIDDHDQFSSEQLKIRLYFPKKRKEKF